MWPATVSLASSIYSSMMRCAMLRSAQHAGHAPFVVELKDRFRQVEVYSATPLAHLDQYARQFFHRFKQFVQFGVTHRQLRVGMREQLVDVGVSHPLVAAN